MDFQGRLSVLGLVVIVLREQGREVPLGFLVELTHRYAETFRGMGARPAPSRDEIREVVLSSGLEWALEPGPADCICLGHHHGTADRGACALTRAGDLEPCGCRCHVANHASHRAFVTHSGPYRSDTRNCADCGAVSGSEAGAIACPLAPFPPPTEPV
jgi:hypothetical protein